ncbi:hypothetical protein [Microbulbifer sp. S227A]|uniref:phage fiber-tail adaptor protein n=1 Tax=Microbulbifer sp. S227A TaxID=3415131 RepID=UPI003C7E780C
MHWSHAKDPDDNADYAIDWSNLLAGDTIQASEWIVPEGLVAGDSAVAGDVTTLWLSGGTHGTVYQVTNRVTTLGGRRLDRSVALLVRNR